MEQDTDPLASNNKIISGGGDAHLLDQILGLLVSAFLRLRPCATRRESLAAT